jgi:membrane-anchored protein YejM (alkaline phosphatase superfamily)
MNADRDRDVLMNRYRNSAHYVDSLIGSLLDQIDLDETLVIVTGDHGESLFDDGTVAHSSLLSRIQTRVPFAISGPRVQTLEAAAGPTDHSDVMPTLFRRLGVDSEHLQGVPGRDLLSPRRRDFVSLVHAKARADGEDQLALVSPTQGFSIRLDRSRGRVLFLGKLTLDGRPSRETVSAAEGDTALEWLEQYLNSLATD